MHIDEAALALPASRGVVVFEGADGRTILIAATGDCRALARRKLGVAPAGARPGADLRSVVAAVRAVECGSLFEAELMYLLVARRLMPDAARLVAERARAWWARIDPGAAFPEWSKTDLAGGEGGGGVAPRSASTARRGASDTAWTLGPFADKDTAGRFTELMTDAFDLCREHRLLVQAPGARACPYKEMGRCPAPCDGSETMESYRARVLDAARACARGLAPERDEAERAMRAAAAGADFEAAARHKQRAERLGRLATGVLGRAGRLEDFRFMIVWRSVREGWVRVAACERGFFQLLADVRVEADGVLAGLCELADRWAGGCAARPMGPEEIDMLGVLARERAASDARRTAWFVATQPGESMEVRARGLRRAGAAALRPRRGKAHGQDARATAERGEHEIEALMAEGPVHE